MAPAKLTRQAERDSNDRTEHRHEIVKLGPPPSERTPHRGRVHLRAGGHDEAVHLPAGIPPTGGTAPLMSEFGVAGILETFGGSLLLLGLFTRPVAFILSGEMQVAYFQYAFPQSFWPVLNNGVPLVALLLSLALPVGCRGRALEPGCPAGKVSGNARPNDGANCIKTCPTGPPFGNGTTSRPVWRRAGLPLYWPTNPG